MLSGRALVHRLPVRRLVRVGATFGVHVSLFTLWINELTPCQPHWLDFHLLPSVSSNSSISTLGVDSKAACHLRCPLPSSLSRASLSWKVWYLHLLFSVACFLLACSPESMPLLCRVSSRFHRSWAVWSLGHAYACDSNIKAWCGEKLYCPPRWSVVVATVRFCSWLLFARVWSSEGYGGSPPGSVQV